MPISPDTPRARAIAAKRREIAALLVADQFASDRSIAEAVGSGHDLVAQVRRSLTGPDGLIPHRREASRRPSDPITDTSPPEAAGISVWRPDLTAYERLEEDRDYWKRRALQSQADNMALIAKLKAAA